jgi:hypothetical protein
MSGPITANILAVHGVLAPSAQALAIRGFICEVTRRLDAGATRLVSVLRTLAQVPGCR